MNDNFLHSIFHFLAKPLLVKELALYSADVIIVLGTVINLDGSPSEAMKLRVIQGLYLFEKGYGGKIIFTGSQDEAETMKNVALALGLREDCFLIEEHATTTEKNALNTKVIMDKENWKTAIIVSSPYHLKRAIRIFRDFGVDVQGSSAFHANVYSIRNHLKSTIHEYLAWLKYLFFKRIYYKNNKIFN
jgi:uncharacterized SAM-binding protein YcdF (DUF218 family)